MLCWNKALKLVNASHMTASANQSALFQTLVCQCKLGWMNNFIWITLIAIYMEIFNHQWVNHDGFSTPQWFRRAQRRCPCWTCTRPSSGRRNTSRPRGRLRMWPRSTQTCQGANPRKAVESTLKQNIDWVIPRYHGQYGQAGMTQAVWPDWAIFWTFW